jgi:hypothetical protein
MIQFRCSVGNVRMFIDILGLFPKTEADKS